MPFLDPSDMLTGAPMTGWTGRFYHSENITFAQWTIAAGAAALHEHAHVQEEVWNVLEGEIALSLDGEERVLRPGDVAVIPPQTPHSARPTTACRVLVADHPLRHDLPGVTAPAG